MVGPPDHSLLGALLRSKASGRRLAVLFPHQHHPAPGHPSGARRSSREEQPARTGHGGRVLSVPTRNLRLGRIIMLIVLVLITALFFMMIRAFLMTILLAAIFSGLAHTTYN